MEKARKKLTLCNKITIAIAFVALIINAVAWLSKAFCDWYIKYIHVITLNTYSRITSLLPFSVGEVMIVCAVILVVAFLVALILKIVCQIRRVSNKASAFAGKYMSAFACICSVVLFVMTCNCFVLYHATGFGEKYLQVEADTDIETLKEIRNYIVEKCNELSKLQKRNEQGDIVYDGDMYAKAIEEMKKLGEQYERLDGYYPNPKKIYFSEFMSQQYVAGIYLPFSMEANVNGIMYSANYPATICHELAHTKGYIYEDDANFIGYLACINSDDVFFQYSGYLSVLFYVDNDFYDALGDKEEYFGEPEISDEVYYDSMFLKEETWEEVEEDAIIDTGTIEEIADVVIDTSLKVNGVTEGSVSYSKVVDLIVRYEQIKEQENATGN